MNEDEEKKQAQIQRLAHEMTKRLAMEGKVLEGGWKAFVLVGGLNNAPEYQLNSMRQAYYSGAQHLFGSILSVLEPGTEDATEADLKVMDTIHKELHDWVMQMKGPKN